MLVSVFFCYNLTMKEKKLNELKTIPAFVWDSYDNDSLCDFLEAICSQCGKNTTPILSENKSEIVPYEPSPK